MMPRLPKIQGAVTPELQNKFLKWMRDNGYRSQGEALSELLTQFFESGDNGDNGDNVTGDNGDIGDNDDPENPTVSGYHRYNDETKTPPNSSELEGKISELEEKVKLLEDNQTSHADRLGDVEENLEGLSCALPDSGDGSVGTSPQNTDTNLDITSDTDLGTNPDYIYTAYTLANELGIKSRTLREQLQKLEIGDIYPRNGKKYKLLSKKPYKLVLVE
jgi:hypothetical protein